MAAVIMRSAAPPHRTPDSQTDEKPREDMSAPRFADRRRSRSRSRSPHGDRGRFGGASSKLVYISNLPYETRWVELKTMLQEHGELAWVDILQDRSGRSKGAAVAEFKSFADAERCLNNMPRFESRGRTVLLKSIRDPPSFYRKIKEETGVDYMARCGGDIRANDRRNTGPEKHETYGLSNEFLRAHHIDLPLVDRIFVANIPFNISCGRIFDIFSMAGRIKWLDLHMDKEGRSKGSAIVEYFHPLEAVQAVSMFNQQKLFDRALLVKLDRFSRTDEVKPGELPRGLLSIGMGLGADGAPLKDVNTVLATIGKPPPQPTPLMGPPNLTSAYPPIPRPFDDMKPPSGAMSTPFPPNGLATQGNSRPRYDTFNNSAGYSSAPVYPVKQEYLDSRAYGQQPTRDHSSRIIVIKNLPGDYTWQIVSDRVASFGDVEGVEMIGEGIARVRYATHRDSERACLALNGTVVEGREIQVDFVH